MATKSRLSTILHTALLRAVGRYAEHMIFYSMLLVTGLVVLMGGWWFLSDWISSWIPHFGWPGFMHWPSWAHLPHWFGSDTAETVTSNAKVEIPTETIATAPAEPDGSCNGWGYKWVCWKN